MNLQESIRRILREDDYSPAGKEVTPKEIVVHKSNTMFRDKIMENGLKARAGECYKIYAGYGEKCIPAIFATNSTNKRAWFDSTYDDDIWFIDTKMIPDVKWYKDRHYESKSKHIVTFQDIPKEAITLKYEGTGKSDYNIQESIRRILKEEVNEMYSKPSENTDRIIENWLDKLFSGAKMYHEETWNTRHDFEWCNNGLEIARVILYFQVDEVRDDKRTTSERDFESGSLSIPKSLIDDLVNYVPIRRNYLKYKIEEWFEDNIFPSVIDKMGRNDIYIQEINEYPKVVQVCAPPVEKPEGITQDDMIDYVVKTTLYKKNELLKKEEEEPGFIEKTYLGKLHNAEIERLRG